jgi:hypothetical protein
LGTARGRADAAQEKAKAAKANIAVKEDFAQAAAAYAEAQPLAASNPDGAIAKYLEAEKLFLASADAANAKREEAQKQLSKAKSDIKEVEDAAELLKKEQKAGGGSQ